MLKFCIFTDKFKKEIELWRHAFPDLKFNISFLSDTTLTICELSLYGKTIKRAVYLDEHELPSYTSSQRHNGDQVACEMCFCITGDII